MDYRNIGDRFINSLYSTFTENHNNLFRYYHHEACLTFNDIESCGIISIKNTYETLNLNNVNLFVANVDYQPYDNNKIIILVRGSIIIYDNLSISNILEFTDVVIITYNNFDWQIINQIFKTK